MLMRALVLILLVATAIWMGWKGGAHRSSPSPPDTEATPTALPLAAPAWTSSEGIARRASAQGVAPPEFREHTASVAPALPGSVRGVLVNARGEPIPHTPVILRQGLGVQEDRILGLTDSDGLFLFDGVAPGQWQAAAWITPRRGQASAVGMQAVEVIAERRSWVDLWLLGQRELRGVILLEEPDTQLLQCFEVEVRLSQHLERIAADTVACLASTASLGASAEPPPDRQELQRRAVAEFLEENPGAAYPSIEQIEEWADELSAERQSADREIDVSAAFSLCGLEAADYVLRIYLDVERLRWAEFAVSLREADANLGALHLRFEDFKLHPPQ